MRQSLGIVSALMSVLLLAGCASSRHGSNPAQPKVPYRIVEPAVAFSLLRDNPTLIIIDLRSAKDYAGPDGHLNGAINLPLDHLVERLPDLERVQRRTFLVYCDVDACGRQGMMILHDHGFNFAVLMAGGIHEWTSKGFGVVYGPERRVKTEEE